MKDNKINLGRTNKKNELPAIVSGDFGGSGKCT